MSKRQHELEGADRTSTRKKSARAGNVLRFPDTSPIFSSHSAPPPSFTCFFLFICGRSVPPLGTENSDRSVGGAYRPLPSTRLRRQRRRRGVDGFRFRRIVARRAAALQTFCGPFGKFRIPFTPTHPLSRAPPLKSFWSHGFSRRPPVYTLFHSPQSKDWATAFHTRVCVPRSLSKSNERTRGKCFTSLIFAAPGGYDVDSVSRKIVSFFLIF